jgi:glucose/arabinose dehydrogenase
VGSGPLARAAPDSEEIILEVPQPFSNHNGGALIFGPDGYLYVGLGDGGSRGDPRGNDQNTGTLLGSILRLDVDGVAGDRNYAIPPDNPFVGDPDSRDEIWAFGMRNPWRISFDRQTDDLWAGDVGQNVWEEVDVIVAGGNYGWNVTEGAHCYRPSTNCATGGLIPPVQEYDHGSGCSITGGYVYRGEALPSLAGVYLYADFCSGRIWGLRYEDGAATVTREIANTGLPIASFGEDAAGELYVLAFDGGVYRVVAASE